MFSISKRLDSFTFNANAKGAKVKILILQFSIFFEIVQDSFRPYYSSVDSECAFCNS